MGNPVYIYRLEIKNLDDGQTGLAVKIWDDYDEYLDDTIANSEAFDSAKGLPADPIELFKLLQAHALEYTSETLDELIEVAQERGAEICGKFIDSETLGNI